MNNHNFGHGASFGSRKGGLSCAKVSSYRDKIYSHYSTFRSQKLIPDSVAGLASREPFFRKIIREHFPKDKGSRILELGCGYGAFQYFIHLAGYQNSCGIDGSPEQVAGAKHLGIKGVSEADLLTYIKETVPESIDVIIMFDVLEHFTKDELSELTEELYRILKTGGRIICHTPNAEGPFGNFMRHWDFTHELAFTRQSITQYLLAFGFSMVQSFEDKPVPHGFKSVVRYILWQYILRKIYRLIITIESGACDKNAIFSQNFLTVATK